MTQPNPRSDFPLRFSSKCVNIYFPFVVLVRLVYWLAMTRQLLDPIRHSVVELMLENYHRQLVLVEHDVAAMKQEMESMQARDERTRNATALA